MSIRIEHSKGKNVTYIIDENRKTVKAILRTDKYEPEKAFQKTFMRVATRSNNLTVRPTDFYDPEYGLASRYIGIAKCHENDTFDPEFGMKLALARAKKKHNKAYYQQLATMSDFVCMLADELSIHCEDINGKFENCVDEENNLLKKTP